MYTTHAGWHKLACIGHTSFFLPFQGLSAGVGLSLLLLWPLIIGDIGEAAITDFYLVFLLNILASVDPSERFSDQLDEDSSDVSLDGLA